MYKVYVKTDEQGRVVAINSDVFLSSLEGWTLIDVGDGDRYHHAQGNYMPLPIHDERGVCRYKLVDGAVVERSAEEMDADYTEPDTQGGMEVRLATLEEQNAMLTECLLEMSELVYV